MTPRTNIFWLGLMLGIAMTASASLRAQPAAAETMQQKGTTGQTAAPSGAVSTDSDLGELDAVQRFPKPDMFTVTTTQQFFYTDNVFYSNANQISSLAYLGSYGLSFVPYSVRDWTPRISLQYNMVRYGNAAEGDFDNENLAFSSQYVFSTDRAWSWTSIVNLTRFTAPHANDHEFYQEVVYDNQITYVKQLQKDAPLFFIGTYDLAYHQANPGAFDRLDNSLSFSLAYYPVPELSVGPYVRPGARTYFNDTSFQHDRDDFNLSAGFDVTYQFCKYGSVSADLSHSNNYSNNSGQSYNETSPGLSLTGSLKF